MTDFLERAEKLKKFFKKMEQLRFKGMTCFDVEIVDYLE